MCVCVCTYIYIYIYVHIYIYIHIYTYIYIYQYIIHAGTFPFLIWSRDAVRAPVHIDADRFTSIYPCIHSSISFSMYTYMFKT